MTKAAQIPGAITHAADSPPTPPPSPAPTSDDETYDICIVGGGPGGLATLSAAIEPYSKDKMGRDNVKNAYASGLATKRTAPKVCVVDPGDTWMHTWHERFKALQIKWLRSPMGAHPDAFDVNSLLAYATSTGRAHDMFDSGVDVKKFRTVREAHSGLLELPSNKLFEDFCQDLAARLPHTFVRGKVAAIQGPDGDFSVSLEGGRKLKAKAVVLALGVPGPAACPAELVKVPARFLFHSDDKLGGRLQELGSARKKEVLVIGGGLTAVQVAQLAVKKGCSKVFLASRRPLVTRHFDVGEGWFDTRQGSRNQSEFFDEPLEKRAAAAKAARGGGSVPPLYMRGVQELETQGRLSRKVGEVQVTSVNDDSVEVTINGRVQKFDLIVNACGHRPDCLQLPVLRELQRVEPIEIVGGFPSLTPDLQWGSFKQLFVIGALASLQVGPDAGNLMGLSRAAQMATDAMDINSFSKYKNSNQSVQGWYQTNRFAEAFDSDSDSDSDSDTDSDSDGEIEIERAVEIPCAA
ncbi:hypothetical protein TrVE_jg4737 [Triparma verrucosa]|uniref:FAD/NAD(P)-binding domain-containing protein n=1 Tax=Triparma verrucosa TaxID=1606542 RepID=A0A9W7CJ54_9STRA|nr:hypothetical protein TrVE_jg4737 [Triparma verrucosa]